MNFPLPLNGREYGKDSKLMSYKDFSLEIERINGNKAFRFSFVIWIYIEDYCPRSQFCTIYQRYNEKSKRFTPNIFLTRNGEILVDVYDKNNVPHGGLTIKKVPLNDWCRMVFLFRSFKVFNIFLVKKFLKKILISIAKILIKKNFSGNWS